MIYFAGPLSRMAGSSEKQLPEGPSPEGSADDAGKQKQQQARQTGSPNADWPAQRRYYDRKISRDVEERREE
jgi:hypothetical protein